VWSSILSKSENFLLWSAGALLGFFLSTSPTGSNRLSGKKDVGVIFYQNQRNHHTSGRGIIGPVSAQFVELVPSHGLVKL
jgi:hypothetical protein